MFPSDSASRGRENALERRGFQRSLVLAALAAPAAGALWSQPGALAAPARAVPCRRTITEYELPPADQTHEIIKIPGKPLVLVSQMSNSALVKLRLDQGTEQITDVRAFQLGPPSAMLHGLAVSQRYPGKIWATHEADNKLLLVDPGADRFDTPPKIVRTIDIPGGGQGPHYVGEYDDQLWVSLKTSDQVLAINYTDPRKYRLYEAKPHPIFVARHPDSGEFYASQDQANEILRINPKTKKTSQLKIPAARGTTPVGLVAGPAGLWVVLLGTKQGATGRSGASTVTVRSPGSRSRRPKVADSYTELRSEEVAALPTQLCKAHRVLPLANSVLPVGPAHDSRGWGSELT